MRKVFTLCLVFIMLITSVCSESKALNHAVEDYSLVIYTYDSLLADPGYDFISGFSNYSGILEEDIQVILLSDANSIVTQAALEKDNPVADVLIGIDNVLIYTAKEEEILQPYDSPALSNISQTIIDNLDSEKYVLPYDMGIIALWHSVNRINTTTNPELANLTLQDILDYDLDKKLVVQNPNFSSPGLGFLLWTIAVYGDANIGFEGLLGQNWRDWWKEAKKDLRIVSSWGDAFSIYYTEEENRPMMVSYGTSPAYDVCHPIYGVGDGNPPPSAAILSHEQNLENAWLQIEGIGLVNNSPHPDAGKQFIDWFLSKELQDNIPLNNWMYPVHENATISSCFIDNSINPNEVDILNNLISSELLKENLEKWKRDWKTEVAPFSNFLGIVLSILTASIAYVIIKKHRN
ncbi:MAG: thiamine ABC transporter substrate-binding protein [Candidatus Heimdallarchaeota archaeon]|nr:thiamine ABC transporter substrate-binding protein [Candidatus Heimdallarchaeota archaeon]MCK5144552.1 thiamine ABC transporter substrate-binding protein [Candidatus Heimdallarchaeota archaeon]